MKKFTIISIALSGALMQGCGDDPKGPVPSGAVAGSAGSVGQPGNGGAVMTAGNAAVGSSGVSGVSGAPGGGVVGGASSGGAADDSSAGEGGMGSAVVGEPVHGVVLNEFAEPLANAVVVVDGVVVNTDAQGKFTLPDVADRYDLLVVVPDAKLAHVYDGLVTRKPTLTMTPPRALESNHASVAGQLSGGAGFPSPVNHQAAVAYASRSRHQYDVVDGTSGSYALSVSWNGAATDDGDLVALQFLAGSKNITSFSGYATKAITFTAGASVPATNMTLINPNEVSVSGTLKLPTGWSVTRSAMQIGPIQIQVPIASGAFTLVYPELDQPQGASVVASGPTGGSFVRSVRPASGAWNLEVVEPAALDQPVQDASAVTKDSSFTWSSPSGYKVSTIVWRIAGWSVRRTTTASSTKLPNLAPYGLVLPAGGAGTWQVTQEGPAEAVEEKFGIDQAFYAAIQTRAYRLMDSQQRRFTVAN